MAERFEVSGLSWMDHEFGTSMLEAEQLGWDWFALQLEDGRDIMLYQMRRRAAHATPSRAGRSSRATAASRALAPSDYTLEPLETWQSPATKPAIRFAGA